MGVRKGKIVTSSMIVLSLLSLGTGSIAPLISQAAESSQQENQALKMVKSDVPVFENNPQATALFPNSLLDWSPATDDNAPFNMSNVQLVPRINGPKVNQFQSEEAKLLSIAIVNRNTAGTPSQGSESKEIYNFTNWQYVDTLVAWAGSAGEGIIIPPSGDITDAAHRNGVPVVGTVFFPPEAYGGKAEWVKDFVKKDAEGRFIVADKLLAMADFYGFDGWFINQETNVDSETAKELENLLLYLQKNKRSDHQIIWYDSMLPSGSIRWQGALNDQNKMYFQQGSQRMSDQMFLDFRWNKDRLTISKDKAIELNRDPFDLYAGLDVQANGTATRANPEDILDENGQLKMSIGLYCPDWTLRDGGNYNMDEYWKNEQALWTNMSNDPRKVQKPTDNNWYGISKYIVEKTPVTSFPFATNFNVGNGDNFYQNGLIARAGSFNNRSIQDVLPTYRWIIDNGVGNDLKAQFSYADAFNGGSSILLDGEMTKDVGSFIKLYASDLDVAGIESGYVVTKGTKTVELVVETADSSQATIIKSQKRTQVESNGWDQDFFSLKTLEGKKITSIGLNLYVDQTGSQNILLGSLLVGDLEADQTVSQVEDVAVTGKTVQDDLTESLRLTWKSAGANTSAYNIYREDENRSVLVGTTSNTSYALLNQKRSKNSAKYTVVPKNSLGTEVQEAGSSVVFEFEELKRPEISIGANSTFVKAGDSVVLSAKVSPSTEKITWQVPGGEILEEIDKSLTVKFSKPGAYSIFAQATNSTGTTEAAKENYVYVYDETSGLKIENLGLLPDVTATEGSGYTNPGESYKFALDGKLGTKWCDNSSKNPYMIVDLGAVKTVTGFALHNAQAGGENADWNTKDYDILVSNDQENWETVVEHRGNTAAVSTDTIAKIEARYVKLYLQKAESAGNTARIYEFEILGINGKNIEVTENAELVGKLRNLYFTGTAKSAENYTVESFAVLAQALEIAKPILDEPGNQQELTEQITALTAAIAQLVLVNNQVSTEPLKQLIETVGQYRKENYTTESYRVLESIMGSALEIAALEKVSAEELARGLSMLQEAVAQLVLESEEVTLSLMDQLELMLTAAQNLNLGDLYTEATVTELMTQIERGIQFSEQHRQSFKTLASSELKESAELHLIGLIDAATNLELVVGQSDEDTHELLVKAMKVAKEQEEQKFTPASYRLLNQIVYRIEEAKSKNPTNTGLDRLGAQVVSMAVEKLIVDDGEKELNVEKEKLSLLVTVVKKFLEELVDEEYAEDSITQLKKAVEKAELSLTSTTIEEIKTAYSDLEQAYKEMKPIDNTLKIAREKLKGLIILLENSDLSSEENAVKETVKELLEKANQLLSKPDATLTDIENLTGAIAAQLAELQDPTAAKLQLATLVKTMSLIQADPYTKDSFAAFEKTLQAGKALLVKEDVIKKELLDGTKAIRQAYDRLALVEKVDKSALEKLIKQAQEYKKSDYTAVTFNSFVQELDNAQLLLVNPEADQREVDTMITTLQKAISKLVKVSGAPEKGKINQKNNEDKSGHSGSINHSKGSALAGQKLPQANEVERPFLVVLGAVTTIVVGLVFWKKRHKEI